MFTMKRQRAGRSKDDDTYQAPRRQRKMESYYGTRGYEEPVGKTTLSFGRNKGELAGTLEENILALLDTQGVKDQGDIDDDKLSFLEAVRAVFLAMDRAGPPSRKIHKAVFMSLQDSTSFEVAFASYSLLMDLAKAYRRDQTWSPLGSVDGESGGSNDCLDVPALAQKLATEVRQLATEASLGIRMVATMLTLHFLVFLWRIDFDSRKDDADAVSLESSFINRQLKGLGRKRFTGFMRNLVDLAQVSSRGLDCAITDLVVDSARSLVNMAVDISFVLAEQDSQCSDVIATILESSEDEFLSFLEMVELPHRKLDLASKYLVSSLGSRTANRWSYQGPILESMLKWFEDDPVVVGRVCKAMQERTLQLLLVHIFWAHLTQMDQAAIATTSTSLVGLFKLLSPNWRSLDPRLQQAAVVARSLTSDVDGFLKAGERAS